MHIKRDNSVTWSGRGINLIYMLRASFPPIICTIRSVSFEKEMRSIRIRSSGQHSTYSGYCTPACYIWPLVKLGSLDSARKIASICEKILQKTLNLIRYACNTLLQGIACMSLSLLSGYGDAWCVLPDGFMHGAGQSRHLSLLHIRHLLACMRPMSFGQGTASVATQTGRGRPDSAWLHGGEDQWMYYMMLARPSGLFLILSRSSPDQEKNASSIYYRFYYISVI